MKIRSIFDNIEIKLICLLLAIVMWLYANNPTGLWRQLYQNTEVAERSEQGKITLREVPIELVGAQKQWEANPGKIELECLGTEVEMSNFQAKVKLTQKDEAEKRVILTQENVELPEGLVFVKAKPDEIRLTLKP